MNTILEFIGAIVIMIVVLLIVKRTRKVDQRNNFVGQHEGDMNSKYHTP